MRRYELQAVEAIVATEHGDWVRWADVEKERQVIADTLRTLMGANAAEPYIRAIERAVASASS